MPPRLHTLRFSPSKRPASVLEPIFDANSPNHFLAAHPQKRPQLAHDERHGFLFLTRPSRLGSRCWHTTWGLYTRRTKSPESIRRVI